MNRGRRNRSLLTPGRGLGTWTAGALVLAGFLACSGDQRSGAAPADSTPASRTDSSTVVMPESATAAARDTVGARPESAAVSRPESAPVTKRESTAVQRDPAPRVATTPSPRKPTTGKPAVPKPVQRDTSTAAAQPAETSAAAPAQTTQANAPMRDQYHTAPLDTVSQQVYDGWKQYNLNCARCHGEDAQGTTIAPHLIVSLKPEGPINTKELFVQTVCAGRPAKGMPAWCALGMEMPTIEAIYAYVKGRSDAKIHPGRPAVRSGG